MVRESVYNRIIALARKENNIDANEAQELIKLIKIVFDDVMCQKYDKRQVIRLTTKFRDAGRRSAPWKPTSGRVPGRPQDGADGNRINRWLLPKTHKFYANEETACLVEIKYYLQALSFKNSPVVNHSGFQNAFCWLVDKPVYPDSYLDPIQLVSIDMNEIIGDARLIQSGHIFPLDRGGKHEPKNTFLMLARSNQLQGNLSVDELLSLMQEILIKHGLVTRQ